MDRRADIVSCRCGSIAVIEKQAALGPRACYRVIHVWAADDRDSRIVEYDLEGAPPVCLGHAI
jgi:hypothetical protein